MISDLYYKHNTIVKDDSIIINKGQVSLTDDTRVIIYDSNMFDIQATDDQKMPADFAFVPRYVCPFTLVTLGISRIRVPTVSGESGPNILALEVETARAHGNSLFCNEKL